MKKRSLLEEIIYEIVVIVMIGVPALKFISYCAYLKGFVKDTFVINQVYLLWLSIPVLILLYILQIVKEKRKLDDFDIITFVLIFLGIISTIFAVDIKKSIFGELYRYEGLLSLLSYYFIFLNVKNMKRKENKEGLMNIFLILGLCQVVYAFLQVFTKADFVFHCSIPHMGMGLCGNPNFFGSYTLLLLLFSLTTYLLKNEKKYFWFSLVYFVGLILSNSTGPFLSLILSFIFLAIVFRKKIVKKSLIIVLVVLPILYLATDYSIKYIQKDVFKNRIDDSYTISSELVNSVSNYKKGEIGNGRLRIWKNSLEIVDDYLILGSGLDTFADVYPQVGNVVYDKAHNSYLQILITNGIFALITYCALCLIIFIKGFKYKDPFKIALYIAFVGYCIQAFANISVIDVAPYFFMILGLMYSYKEDFKEM